MQKTKMIFTLGPASENEEVLSKLIEAGMSASRHNFSHGDHEEHRGRIELVKKLREKYNKPIAIILDTKGPEIRTGHFNEKTALKEGQDYTFYCGEEIEGDATKCSLSYAALYEDVKPGDRILVADGLIGFGVKSVEGNKIHCTVLNSNVIASHKNVNVPGVNVKLPAVTAKDESDLIFGCEIGVDIITASFIRKAADVLAIRKVLDSHGGEDIKIVSKVENHEGVANIDEIIKFSDGIMVARGDMGVEMPIEKVPVVQKMIIDKCNKAGKFVITATQMLDSMERNPRPTRAEASDVANAIFDGTDAIMLSGETANGNYPVEAANTMATIAREVEGRLNHEAILKRSRSGRVQNVPNAICYAACTAAMELNAGAIITVTKTGNTARRISNYRPECPVLAVTPDPSVARKLALNWGVFPIITENITNTDTLMEKSVELASKAGYVNKGDLVVLAAGLPVYNSGTTNMLKVEIVGDILVEGKGAGTKPGYGTAYVLEDLKKAEEELQNGDILVVRDLDKDFITLLDRVGGVVAEEGGLTSHLAVECISREIPLVSMAKDATKVIKTGAFISVDSGRGVVYSGRTNIR